MISFLKSFFRGNVVWMLLIAAVAALAFWPVLSGGHPMKWDAMDYYFPSRHLLSQYISEGTMPYWCPYQNLGYPLYADPQSGAWYPISLFLASISDYPLWMIGFEFVLHVMIAGWGMFFLARHFALKNESAFLAAISYMLCGVFVSNAQHLTWIISAAWLPIVVNTFLLLLRTPAFKHALQFALAFFMMFSGGYPAFAFILVYLLLSLWLVKVIRIFRHETKQAFWRLFIFSTLAVGAFLLMSLFILLAEYQVLSWMSRGNGITLEMALFGPFSVESLVSFWSPYSVALSDFSSLNTDLSMANGSMGLFALLFFVSGLFVRQPRELKTILIFGLVSLAVSLGSTLPLRELLYHYLPAMNLFRFPAVFRLFFIFSAILVAAVAANRFVFEKKVFPKHLSALFSVALVTAIIVLVVLRFKGFLSLKEFLNSGLFHFLSTATANQHLAVDMILTTTLLAIALMLIIRNSKVIQVFRIMLVLAALQLVFSVRTNAPYTVHSEDVVFSHAHTFVKSFPGSIPSLQMTAVGQNEASAPRQSPFWRNLNLFNRQVSADGFTPFKAAQFAFLQDSLPEFLDLIIKNPAVYLSRNIVSPHEVIDQKACLTDSTLTTAELSESIAWKTDSTPWEKQVSCSAFEPNRMAFDIQTNLPSVLILQQNNYQGWTASLDNAPSNILAVNFTEIGLLIPAGKHQVVFSFEPKGMRLTTIISACSFLLAIIALLLIRFLKREIN